MPSPQAPKYLARANFTDRFGQPLEVRSPQSLEANTDAFVKALEKNPKVFVEGERVTTTLHPSIQLLASELLNDQINSSQIKSLQSGAILVADHQTDEVLAYAVAGGETNLSHAPWAEALDPMVYTMALDRGYTGASLVPESSKIWITLREAVYRKAHMPIEQIIGSMGPQALAWRLKDLGVHQTGKLNLEDLVGAYATFARGGIFRPLKWMKADHPYSDQKVFSDEATTIMNDILSKAELRETIIPENTAGYSVGRKHEGIAILYNFKYVVGVWLADFNQSPSVDATQVPTRVAKKLLEYLSPSDRLLPLPAKGNLVRRHLCRDGMRIYQWDGRCESWTELMPGTPSAPKPESKSSIDFKG